MVSERRGSLFDVVNEVPLQLRNVGVRVLGHSAIDDTEKQKRNWYQWYGPDCSV